MNYSIRQLGPPAIDCPLTLDQAKKSLEIELDFTDDDTLIDELRVFARDYIEKTFDARLNVQTVEQLEQCFPRGAFDLRVWPVQAVEYFRYRDSAGDDHELTEGTHFKARLYTNPCQVLLPFSGSWPGATLDTADPIRIGLRVGFITDGSPETLPMPASVVQACRLIVGQSYEHREPFMDDTLAQTVRAILQNTLR